jgi:hypothetical protein
MKKALFFALMLGFFGELPVFAQDKKTAVRVEPFIFEGLSIEESRIIETLFQSYLNTYLNSLGMIPLYLDADDHEIPPGDGIAEAEIVPDFTFSARVVFDRDFGHLTISVGDVRGGESSSFSANYRTTGELILGARAFMESILARGIPAPGAAFPPVRNILYGAVPDAGRAVPPDFKAEPINERNVTGTWRSDLGVELVRLRQGGRGMAILSSGVQMDLVYTIADDTLFVTQSSANQARYYHPLPYRVAEALTASANPMRWIFLLYGNGTALWGIRITTAVRYEGDEVLELIPNSAQESGWTKLSR